MLARWEDLPALEPHSRRISLERAEPDLIRRQVMAQRYYLRLKRLADLIILVAALPAVIPVMILCALVIAITSGRPIFFVQDRVGRDGETFRLIKFRSMHVHQAVASHATMQNDPRITAIGAVLRRTHLDELPQLWNIFVGEMSLVGPRPEQPKLVDRYREALPHYDLRTIVRPGLSGWSQVNFGYAATLSETREKLEYDLYYLTHLSILLDCAIIFMTLKVYLKVGYVR